MVTAPAFLPDLLQVLDKRPRMPPVGVGRVDALGRKIVELLEVGVHDDLLLVRVLKRLRARNGLVIVRVAALKDYKTLHLIQSEVCVT
jgi:hypothetical protein